MHNTLLKIYVNDEPLVIPAGIGVLEDEVYPHARLYGSVTRRSPLKHGFTLGDSLRMWGRDWISNA